MSILLQRVLQGCLLKNGIWHKKRHLAHFYSLVRSSPQADSIRMGSLTQGIPTPWAAPLTIWWRWVHSFTGYSRGVCWKTAFGTFCSLVSSSRQADSIRMGSLPQGIPTHWAVPLTIWLGWAYSFRGYSTGVCWKNKISYKKWLLAHFTHW